MPGARRGEESYRRRRSCYSSTRPAKPVVAQGRAAMATALAHSSHLTLPCAPFNPHPHLHPIPAARPLRLPLSQRICAWRSAGCSATSTAGAARASGSVAEETTSTSPKREVSWCCPFSCGVVILVWSLSLALSPLLVPRGGLEGQSCRSKRH